MPLLHVKTDTMIKHPHFPFRPTFFGTAKEMEGEKQRCVTDAHGGAVPRKTHS